MEYFRWTACLNWGLRRERIENIQGVDHIGYAVRNMELAKEYFMALGFSSTENKEDELRNVNVSVGCMGDIKVELLSPIAGRKFPIDGYLQKLGSTPYHICYRVDDIYASAEKLEEFGFTLLGFPTPSVPLGGRCCLFVFGGNWGCGIDCILGLILSSFV